MSPQSQFLCTISTEEYISVVEFLRGWHHDVTMPTVARTRGQRRNVHCSDESSIAPRRVYRRKKSSNTQSSDTQLPPSPADTPEPSDSISNISSSRYRSNGRRSANRFGIANGDWGSPSTVVSFQTPHDGNSGIPFSPDDVSPDIARLVVRLQEHYALEQHDLAARLDNASEEQQKALSRLCDLSENISEVKTETKGLKARLDGQVELFQHIADFMEQVAEGKFGCWHSGAPLASVEQSQDLDGLAAGSQLGVDEYLSDVEQLQQIPEPSISTRAPSHVSLENLPPTPLACTPLRSTGLKATKRRVNNYSSTPSRPRASLMSQKKARKSVTVLSSSPQTSLEVRH